MAGKSEKDKAAPAAVPKKPAAPPPVRGITLKAGKHPPGDGR